MEWNLYLDNNRTPKNTSKWVVARTVDDAKELVLANGCPKEFSLDHDLGYVLNGKLLLEVDSLDQIPEELRSQAKELPNGYEFCKWLTEEDYYGKINIPEDVIFNYHTANPVGEKNMRSTMERYLERKFVKAEE